MLVCHCHRVTDRQVRQCVRDGARCAEQVAAGCHAGSACGGCVPLVEALIQLESRREPSGRPAPESTLDSMSA